MRVRLLMLMSLIALLVPFVGVDARAESLDEIRGRLAEAQDERERIEARIAASTEELEAFETRIAELASERDELVRRTGEARERYDTLADAIATRIREAYKHGSTIEPMAVFLGSDDPDAALSRAEHIARVVAGDQAESEEFAAARARFAAAEERLAARTAELEETRRRQRAAVESLQEDFETIQELEDRLTREERQERERLERVRLEQERREAARQAADTATGEPAASADPVARTAPRGSGGTACPLDRPRSFIDSWGYARSGGRSHRGTDLMGPRGIPVRAITDGTWEVQSPGPSAGRWGILHGDDGNDYWYLHLDGHTVGNGVRVQAGQQVATNGATGNATAGAEHVHFELHPGGGSAVNPYGTLRRACG